MLELLISVLFLWLSYKFIGLALKITWGVAKLIASLLFVVALPSLVICILFAGGLLLIIPVLMMIGAIALLSSSV
ncbi:hypothetical protein [Pseudoflavonifractor phocaeensis]|uniref:hypothetical protein n=1 Tax=Pseudoflavonifractor phocaeensis TaxID=1870988 RepID=UPI001F234B46|nr:hypothetical protein [Pseudoflavonifractor phocaeensis]MCF2661217.1 hypothetical protein [Pseudoflavonifractor phocaeensis]